MGALVAVEFCRDLGLRDTVLEGDSKLVINAIIMKAPSQSTYGNIVGDTLEVLKVLEDGRRIMLRGRLMRRLTG
jgi:ribonuclease HI